MLACIWWRRDTVTAWYAFILREDHDCLYSPLSIAAAKGRVTEDEVQGVQERDK